MDEMDIKHTLETQTTNRVEIYGYLIWIEGTVFYCSKCDKRGRSNGGRYDYAILFKNDYKNTIRCRKCNGIVELKKQESILGGRICPSAWQE